MPGGRKALQLHQQLASLLGVGWSWPDGERKGHGAEGGEEQASDGVGPRAGFHHWILSPCLVQAAQHGAARSTAGELARVSQGAPLRVAGLSPGERNKEPLLPRSLCWLPGSCGMQQSPFCYYCSYRSWAVQTELLQCSELSGRSLGIAAIGHQKACAEVSRTHFCLLLAGLFMTPTSKHWMQHTVVSMPM